MRVQTGIVAVAAEIVTAAVIVQPVKMGLAVNAGGPVEGMGNPVARFVVAPSAQWQMAVPSQLHSRSY